MTEELEIDVIMSTLDEELYIDIDPISALLHDICDQLEPLWL